MLSSVFVGRVGSLDSSSQCLPVSSPRLSRGELLPGVQPRSPRERTLTKPRRSAGEVETHGPQSMSHSTISHLSQTPFLRFPSPLSMLLHGRSTLLLHGSGAESWRCSVSRETWRPIRPGLKVGRRIHRPLPRRGQHQSLSGSGRRGPERARESWPASGVKAATQGEHSA